MVIRRQEAWKIKAGLSSQGKSHVGTSDNHNSPPHHSLILSHCEAAAKLKKSKICFFYLIPSPSIMNGLCTPKDKDEDSPPFPRKFT